MTRIAALILSAVLAAPAIAQLAEAAQEPESLIRDATEVTPAELEWVARPLVVFADSPNDPRFVQQLDLIEERLDTLAERDVVVITDTDPADPSEFRESLRPRGFMLVVLAKDGSVILRKPAPWSVREITRSIDKQPLRQQEIRDRRSDE
ncbi:MAG: DUF4174 domain-containing protein [Paracoccaceae bacterium]